MGNLSNKEYTLEDIIKYNGNEEEFIKLNEKLDKPFEHKLIYEDLTKAKLKYMGQMKDLRYEGRGILYLDYTYDGYFKDGIKNGYFRVYKNSSKELIYQGFYKDDIYNGKGILYGNEGEKLYNGIFDNGLYSGIGIEYFQKEKLKRKMFYKNGEPSKECLGVLYRNNDIIYKGLLKDYKPENGKDITIYDNRRKISYIGDLSNFKYNGKGILYYEKSKHIYFDGIFNMDLFIKGILYDPEGNKIYEGEFMNGQPKECKNINLYEINRNLIFTGDLMDGKYIGHGKLYKETKLLYEGNFKDGLYDGYGILYINEDCKYEGLFKEGKYDGHGKIIKEKYLYFEGEFEQGKKHGKGIIYYPNKQKCFEGNYENNERKGEGIKYYDNGSKKIEAIYTNTKTCKGKYYSPDNELLYEGDIIDEVPCGDKNFKIYNDFTYRIYIGEIKDEIYNITKEEYYPNNYYMSEKLEKDLIFKIHFPSFESLTGKTTLINRLVSGNFLKETSATIGLDFRNYDFEKNDKKYKGVLFDLNGQELSRETNKIFCKDTNIVVFVLNMYANEKIDERYIKQIQSVMNKDSQVIYFVGNKIVYPSYNMNVETNRNKIRDLIKKNEINKYFEVDAKTGEGFDILIKNLQFDIIKYSNKFIVKN